MGIEDNVRRVQERIEAARRRRAGAEPVTLVAVTKGRAPELIRRAIAAGISEIGENRVQEAKAKWPALESAFAGGGVRRHMVGHLQRNKVGTALEFFDMVQSVDSLRLARKISGHAGLSGGRVPVLLQVNGGSEETKFGFAPEEVEAVVPEIAELPGLALAGLMTLAPEAAPEATLRGLFADLRQRFDRLSDSFPALSLRHLSMGMSSDFEIAVEEGATMVRIGSALFEGA